MENITPEMFENFEKKLRLNGQITDVKNVSAIECNERFMQEQNDADDLNLITDKLVFLMEKTTDQFLLMKLANIFIETQTLKRKINSGTGNFNTSPSND